MRKIIATVCLLLAAGSFGKVKLTEDRPPVGPPKSGELTGRITPAADLVALTAVSRATGAIYLPAEFDKKTGKFIFRKLSGDASYDLCLDTRRGRRIEGIDLDFVDARLLRLAELRRKQLKLPPQPGRKFTAADAKALLKYVRDLKDFMEIRRVLYIRGHGRRATMLLELMRTREYHAAKGTIIWRVELWYFEYQHGGWERLANQERLLKRVRTTPELWRKINVEYYPQLSAYVDAAGKSRPVLFEIPAKGNITRGRLANTAPNVKTAPHILGLDVKAAATAPATGKSTSRPAAK